MTENHDRTASFGFREVPAGEKSGMVRGVFDSVATRYDLMNDAMSFGVHRIWKEAFVDRLAPRPGMRLLDVAGGTGDVALKALARADRRAGPPATAVICDINYEMLQAGLSRREAERFEDRLSRVTGDAETLPLPDNACDAYTIAFGIRNVTDMDAALSEAHRVLRPGGRFFCLEFSHPITEGLQAVYDAYSFNLIPRMGAAIAGDRESYQYLVESIRRFPNQPAFARRIEDAGFRRVAFENFSGGVAAVHSGWKI
ncbi:MAG: class I SAM-dependent methyltransferase [Pseudomonadota bacterium]